MGTRNLVCVQKDDELVVAKYCQWDGCPDGQGRTVFGFILNKFNEELFLKQLNKVSDITQEQYKAAWVACGASPDSDGVTVMVSNKMKETSPHLQRDFGGEILGYIQDWKDEELLLSNAKEFAHDSLFCEYAYVLNLDDSTVDCFRGFNKTMPPKTIFFDPEKYEKDDTKAYYPIKKIDSFTFDEIRRIGVAECVFKLEKTVTHEEENDGF